MDNSTREGPETQYEAFICYRHAGPDAAMAKALHQALEHFDIPASLKEALGRKKTGKIFRDREELPTSANLGADIEQALRGSRFLILVCSPRLPESEWCMKEVDYFLSLGRRDHILTLLIEGEPAESFPPQLRFVREDGRTTEVEPLAADVRARGTRGRKRRLRSEKLRLLAPLLGVEYDDLNRRHSRQMRRKLALGAAVAAAVLLLFGTVFYNQRMQIRLTETQAAGERVAQLTVKDLVKTVKGRRTQDGAGVSLIRVIGHDDVREADPFLMLDAFDSADPADYIKGFPFHPHRGIETVTYLIDGQIDHRDSLGNEGSIRAGEAQWMTAGSGIMHEEMPQACPRLFGLQLWVNLPAKDKMTAPRYFGIDAGMTPVVEIPGGSVRVVAGSFGDARGVAPAFVQATMLDVTLAPGTELDMPVERENTVLVYTLEGGGRFGPGGAHEVDCRTAAIFGEGDAFYAKAGGERMLFMLFAGRPLREPVAWGGPIAMNTEEELQTAFAELRAGTFVK